MPRVRLIAIIKNAPHSGHGLRIESLSNDSYCGLLTWIGFLGAECTSSNSEIVATLTMESAQSEQSSSHGGRQRLKRYRGRSVAAPSAHESPEQSGPRAIQPHRPK